MIRSLELQSRKFLASAGNIDESPKSTLPLLIQVGRFVCFEAIVVVGEASDASFSAQAVRELD